MEGLDLEFNLFQRDSTSTDTLDRVGPTII